MGLKVAPVEKVTKKGANQLGSINRPHLNLDIVMIQLVIRCEAQSHEEGGIKNALQKGSRFSRQLFMGSE